MPGGWHKPEKDRLGRDMPHPISALSYPLLIDAVIKFRADNVIPIGDVKAEVDDYICTNFPRMCHGSNADISVTVDVPKTHMRTVTDNMIQTMDEQIKEHSVENLELKQEAQRRSEICRRCRFNVKWNTGCGSCREAVNRMSMILRSGNSVPHERELHACQILGHENRSAVWLKLDKIKRSPELPGFCWARR
jgi:hypothetical protein